MELNVKILRGLFIFSLVILLGITSFGAYLLVITNMKQAGVDDPTIPNLPFSDAVKQIAPLTTPINVLLLAESGGNTDTMMVVHFDPVTCKTSIISVLRDTSVLYNNSLVKVNSLYARGGVQACTEAVSKLLGINIDNYVYINTEMTRKIVDEFGGAYYDVPCRMKYTALSQNLHIDLQPGYQLLDGNKVEQLLRFRHPGKEVAPPYSALTVADYADCQIYMTNDVQRAITQQSFLVSFVKQKARPEYLTKINKLLQIILKNTKTDINFTTIMRLLYNKQELSSDKITTYSTVFAGNSYKYSGTIKDNTNKKQLTLDETNQILTTDFSSDGRLFKATLSDSTIYRQQGGHSSNSGNTSGSNSGTTSPTQKPNSTPRPTQNPTATPNPTKKPINNTPAPVITPQPTLPPQVTQPPATMKPDTTARPTDSLT